MKKSTFFLFLLHSKRAMLLSPFLLISFMAIGQQTTQSQIDQTKRAVSKTDITIPVEIKKNNITTESSIDLKKNQMERKTKTSFDLDQFKQHTNWDEMNTDEKQKMINRLNCIKKHVDSDLEKQIDDYLKEVKEEKKE